MSESLAGLIEHANATNETLPTIVCGSEAWRGSQSFLTAFGISCSVLSFLFYILSTTIAVKVRHDALKKTLSVSALISGTFVGTLSLPVVLWQMTASPHQKTTRFCLTLQVLQLIAVIVYIVQLVLVFAVPLLLLKNPFRQTFFQSIKGRVSLVGGSWALSILAPGAPGLSLIVTSGNSVLPCCGWHLFPKAYSLTVIYGGLFPLVISSFYASGKFLYMARQKAKETALPMSLRTEADPGVNAASRKKRKLQCRWLSMLLLHCIVSTIPSASVVVIYLHCPFCVHPELMLYIISVLMTFVALMVALSNFSFQENRDTFQRLFIRCNWRGGRVESL